VFMWLARAVTVVCRDFQMSMHALVSMRPSCKNSFFIDLVHAYGK
jgi:hypothetical protein